MRTKLVSKLKLKATRLRADLERTKRPVGITQHAVPRVYLIDVEAWETLQRKMKLLDGIERGERALEDGRVLTQAQARRRMSRWLK